MKISIGVNGKVSGSMTGEPNDVFERLELFKRSLANSGLEFTFSIETEVFASACPTFGGRPLSEVGIEELELSERTSRALMRSMIRDVGELISKSEFELRGIPNFGDKAVENVTASLAMHGLRLAE